MSFPDVRIRIKLLSEAIFDSGEQVANHVHSQALSDDYGCVYYHAKTLKGVLKRQAFWLYQVYRAMGREDAAMDFIQAVADLFGFHEEEEKLYGIENVTWRQGYMRLGNLQLPSSVRQQVHNWLTIHANQDNTKSEPYIHFSPQDMLEAQTNVRTMIQMEDGLVKDRMFTSFHTVKQGLVFESVVEFDQYPAISHVQHLARIVRSLERIGAGENRGYGRVDATLWINGKMIKHPDEVEAILYGGNSDATDLSSSTDSQKSDTGVRYYVIEILNEEPLKIGATGSKSNPSERSKQHIPGSTIRGGLISQLKKMNAFNEGKADFLQYIQCQNGYLFDKGQLFMPTPQHLRLNKHDYRKSKVIKTTVTLSDYDLDADPSAGKNHIPYRYVTIARDNQSQGEGVMVGGKVKQAYRLHHSTIRKPDQKEKQNLYNYQAISPGHTFRAVIRYEGKHADLLDQVLAEGHQQVWYLGGARSSGYGKCLVKTINICRTYEEAVRMAGYSVPRIVQGRTMILTCLTDCLFRDRYGQPMAGISDETVEQWLESWLPGNHPVKVISRRMFLQTSLSEGYHAVWNARYPKETLISAGSVMKFELSRDLSEEEWKEVIRSIEAVPHGNRVQEGLGWLLVNVDYPKRLATVDWREGEAGDESVYKRHLQPMESAWEEDQEAAKIIRSALVEDRYQWLAIIAERTPLSQMTESNKDSHIQLTLSDGLYQSHLYRMLGRIQAWLENHKRNLEILRQPFYKNLPDSYAFYEKDTELFAINGQNLLDVLDYLDCNCNPTLDKLTSKYLSTTKGKFYYVEDQPENINNMKKAHRYFIAELAAVILYLASRERKGAVTSGQ